MTLPQGEVEHKYEILAKLSEGGMGAIYKVRHRLLDEVRVLKVIRPQNAGDPELQRRFMQEARTAKELRHPNIAQIYDFSIDREGSAAIVMEFIDGETLEAKLARGGPPQLDFTLEVAVQCLEALAYLHHRGFLHRDISPDNLMLSRDYEGRPLVKLIDLGVAKRLGGEAMTATGMFLGKVRYAAPEQFGAEANQDTRSDLYSFGVMFYEMLTGKRPIAGETFPEIVGGHLYRPPLDFDRTDPEGRVPKALRVLVMRTLEKDPEARIGSAGELLQALRDFRGMGPPGRAPLDLTVASPSPPPRPSDTPATELMKEPAPEATPSPALPSVQPVSSRRALRAAVLLVAILAAAALTWWATRPSRLLTPAQSAYQLALQALDEESWSQATSLLRQAVAVDPVEKAGTIAIDRGREEPYLPHFFLGQAYFRLRNCVRAFEEWQIAEAQGVVQTTAWVGELREGQKACNAQIETAISRARTAVDQAGAAAAIVSDMLDDPALEPMWRKAPAAAEAARQALQDFDDREAAFTAAVEKRDLTVILDTAQAMLDVKKRLEAAASPEA